MANTQEAANRCLLNESHYKEGAPPSPDHARRGRLERFPGGADAEPSQPWLDEDRGGNCVVLRGNSMGQGWGALDTPEREPEKEQHRPSEAREPLGSGWMLLKGH